MNESVLHVTARRPSSCAISSTVLLGRSDAARLALWLAAAAATAARVSTTTTTAARLRRLCATCDVIVALLDFYLTALPEDVAVWPRRGGAERSEAERSGAKRSGVERSGAERTGAERGGAERGRAERCGAERRGGERSELSVAARLGSGWYQNYGTH